VPYLASTKFSGSIAEGADLSLVLKILILSSSRHYLLAIPNIYTLRILLLQSTWYRGGFRIASSITEHVYCNENSLEAGECSAVDNIQKGGTVEDPSLKLAEKFNFDDYALVCLSSIGSPSYIEILKMFDMIAAALDAVLRAEELPDQTWELPVLRTYLPTLEAKLRTLFPGCNIESDYDPTEPNPQETEMFGYGMAKALRTDTACDRADRMRNDTCLKAALFYSHLSDTLGGGRQQSGGRRGGSVLRLRSGSFE
jgi:hypothetical protein